MSEPVKQRTSGEIPVDKLLGVRRGPDEEFDEYVRRMFHIPADAPGAKPAPDEVPEEYVARMRRLAKKLSAEASPGTQKPDDKELEEHIRRVKKEDSLRLKRKPGEDLVDYLRRTGVNVLNYSRRGAASPEEGARTDIIWNAKSLDEVLKIAERRFGNKGKPK